MFKTRLELSLDSPESGISSLNSTPNKIRSKDTYSPIYDEPAKTRRFLSPTMFSSRELSPRDEFRYHYPVLPSYSTHDGYQHQNTSGPPGLPMVLPGTVSPYTGNAQNTPEYNTNTFSEHFALSSKKSPFNIEHLAPASGSGNTSAWQNFSAYGASSSSNENSPYELNTYPMTSLSGNYGRFGSNVCKHGLHHCSVCAFEATIPPLNSM